MRKCKDIPKTAGRGKRKKVRGLGQRKLALRQAQGPRPSTSLVQAAQGPKTLLRST